MRTMSIRRTIITLAAAAALLTGCGAGGDTGGGGAKWEQPADNGVAALAPNEALERAKTALQDAKSFRLKGAGKSDGEQTTIDLRVSGNDVVGRLSMGEASFEMLAVDGQRYMRADKEFWAQNAGAEAGDMAKLLGDKWLKVPGDDKDLDGLFGLVDVDEMLKPDGRLTKGESKEIKGVPTIGLVDEGEGGGTIYVATAGEPYPMQMVTKGSEAGELTFSDFGATFDDLKAPADDEVVDLSKLANRN